MLHETVLYLLIIGFFSFFQTRKKNDVLFSFVLTAFVFLVFTLFLMDWHGHIDAVQTFVLDKSQSGNIKLDIISSEQNYALILPFFVGTLFALVNNLIFKYEPHKCHMSSLFIFNLISFILLITGTNFIQLMTFVFMIDILSQLLIGDSNASKRYSIYNLIADMGLFLVLAMMQGKLFNLDVGNISHYYETGHHRDFIVFVIMLSLAIKFGFFLFQGYWLDLKSAKFHTLYFLPYLSTPMAALILFIKFYPLLVVSPSFLPLLNIMVILSMVWGALGAILNPQIKEKFVYCNMLCIAFLVKMIEQVDFVWTLHFSNMLITLFVFNLCLYYLHAEIDRGHAKNKLGIYAILITLLLDLVGLTICVVSLQTQANLVWVLTFGGLFLLVLSHLFALFAPKLNTRTEWKNENFQTLALMCAASALLCYLYYPVILDCWQAYFVLIVFYILYRLRPLMRIKFKNSFCLKIQNEDWFTLIYEKCIIQPLKHAGVLFNILIDLIFLERTLWPAVASMNTFLIKAYRRVSRLGLIYYFLSTVFGCLLAMYFFYKG